MKMTLKLLGCLLATAVVLPVAAGTPIQQTRPLDARGRVEIENVKGRVEVVAWDRPEVKVDGTLGGGGAELLIEGDGRVLRIKVRNPTRSRNVEPTNLQVRMPQLADLEVESVSADIRVQGMASREMELESVSGDIVATGAPRKGSISTVSGDLHLTLNSQQLEVGTVSGDVVVQGRLKGTVGIESVSGDVRLDTLGERLRKLSATSVSGDLQLRTALADDGEMRLESVSGDLVLQVPSNLSAQVHGESFSGTLSVPGATIRKEAFGPGASFHTRYGAGKGDVRIETLSGDVRLVMP